MTQQEDAVFSAIINPSLIHQALDEGCRKAADSDLVRTILAKASTARGLNLEEASILLHLTDQQLISELYACANSVKEQIYGKRIVLFAPLYVSNYCVNSCGYCGYNIHNKEMKRLKLTAEQITAETEALLALGHKRLALEAGEDPVNLPLNYILESIQAIYKAQYKGLSMRRINVNIAAAPVDDYKQLHAADIGTYILFQESYHQETYEKMHPRGPKSNFAFHTTAMHRAMQGGIDDVGFGVLFGLYDHKYEALSMLHHASVLEQDTGVGPHTISVPRLKKAATMDLSSFPHALSDDDFFKLIAVLRLALPYAGLILSTRESVDLRRQALHLGVSQMSAGSCTGVGGYTVYKEEKTEQFSISDERSPLEVVLGLMEDGYIPSFCTACYRQGRTGDRFMALAKTGEIQKICEPNALITLQEFLLDFADQGMSKNFLNNHMASITDERTKNLLQTYLDKLNNNERDLFF